MNFIEFLTQKKIDSESFLANDAAQWQEWQLLFQQMHPESFVAQKKFLINKIRRLYPLLSK